LAASKYIRVYLKGPSGRVSRRRILRTNLAKYVSRIVTKKAYAEYVKTGIAPATVGKSRSEPDLRQDFYDSAVRKASHYLDITTWFKAAGRFRDSSRPKYLTNGPTTWHSSEGLLLGKVRFPGVRRPNDLNALLNRKLNYQPGPLDYRNIMFGWRWEWELYGKDPKTGKFVRIEHDSAHGGASVNMRIFFRR
jgi:hypothetical protein